MTPRISLLLAALCAGAVALACGGGRSQPARVRAGDVEIAVSVSPRAPRVGENELVVELRDPQGQPIEGADVGVEVKMPAMGAMPGMGGPARVEARGDGRYRAGFALPMVGTWRVEVRATPRAGQPVSAEGSLTVGTPGVRLEATETNTPAAPVGGEHAAHLHGAAAPAPPSGAAHPGEFQIDPSRLRQVGIGSEPVRREDFATTVRAVGRVTWDETELRDVTARVEGFAGAVEADALLEPVTRGQVLFELYSPQLWAAQREYLEALRAQSAARATSAPERADALVRAAAERMRLWGIDDADIAAMARHGAPLEYLPVRAPVSGYLVAKEIVAGSRIEVGQRIYRIAPADRVWVDAEVYEAELPHVAAGMPAEITLPYLPGQRFEAKVAYVYPSLQADRRTARVRLELPNPQGALRPDMYATVLLRSPLGPRLSVPVGAVLRAGDESFVFLDLGEGHLRPQRVATGIESDGRVEILSGLAEGQLVVSSGTFLVAGESRLRAALESW
jgi:Cu(I)/Ag(I) efflux system membrane fusion protein